MQLTSDGLPICNGRSCSAHTSTPKRPRRPRETGAETALVGSLTDCLRDEKGKNRPRVVPDVDEAGELQPDRLDHGDGVALTEDDTSLRDGFARHAGEVVRRASLGVGAARGLMNLSAGSIVRAAGIAGTAAVADPLRLRTPFEHSSKGISRILTGWPGRKGQQFVVGSVGL